MKYLCLLFEGPSAAQSADSHSSHTSASGPPVEALPGEAIGAASAAVTVRVRGGELYVEEGSASRTTAAQPVFRLIEAKDLNDAIRVAGRMPAAWTGRVELRPVNPG